MRGGVAVLLGVAVVYGALGREVGMNGLTDKTLVAWVQPADLTQRGAGVLGLMEDESFDSIVLGERAPGRWMAGSDFFRRTLNEQGQLACPAETVGAHVLVQLAAVYRGKEITLYRDGSVYSRYTIEAPQRFSRDAAVLIGLRYAGGMGAVGFFHGVIEEARLYDAALDAEAIARLRPGTSGMPEPVGCWTFDDGTARDVSGHWPTGVLCGGAKIEGGRLHLNGRDAYVVCERPTSADQRMFYRARRRATGGQWDTWLYHDRGINHLFLLAGGGGQWHGIATATSRDGVTWREGDLVVRRAEGVTWLGTGSTWRSPERGKDRRFLLNFSEWRGDRQTIHFAESRDLRTWRRLGPEYEFRQDARWYDDRGRWDCIYAIPRPGGGLYGYWTATPTGFVGFGFGESDDGAHWRALAPPRIEWGARTPMPNCEVGAVEKINDRYYLMLGSWGYDGYHGGMWTFVAERPDGPFRPVPKNYSLLATRGRGDTYFARFYPTPDGLLVNHHSIARDGRVWFAPLKSAVTDAEGTLRLGWWHGNDRLRRRPVTVKLPGSTAALDGPVILGNTFRTDDGLLLEGRLPVPAEGQLGPGLRIGCGQGTGMDIRVQARGLTLFGPSPAPDAPFVEDQRVDREIKVGPTASFRLLVKGPLMEFYLDDVLMGCFSLPGPASGKIMLLPSGDGRRADGLRAWD